MFKAVDSIEQAVLQGETFTHDLDDEIAALRQRIEAVVDTTVAYAATFGWQKALKWGGFDEMFKDFEDLAVRLSAYQP